MLYLAYLGGHDLGSDLGPDLGEDLEGPWREVVTLRPGLMFVDSDQSRSVVYHALKDELPPGTPLLVAACHEVPKFKGMAPGALAWARAHVDTGSAAGSVAGG